MKPVTGLLGLMALTAATFVLFACAAPPDGENYPSTETTNRDPGSREPRPTRAGRVITLGDSHFSEDEVGRFVSWGCNEYGYVRGLVGRAYGIPILVEIGRFGSAELSSFGFILYDGSSSGELTTYQRKGVNQRWDWGPNGEFAFILKPDGTGLFYDFSYVPQGETTRAEDMYTCFDRW
jgi:hypothetical protein